MTRKEEISKAARDYVERQTAGLLGIEKQIAISSYEAGAEWADLHQQSHWHSVAAGDFPKDDELYLCSDGSDYIIGEFDKKKKQFNNPFPRFVNNKIDWAEYWMEIPQLPKKGGTE